MASVLPALVDPFFSPLTLLEPFADVAVELLAPIATPFSSSNTQQQTTQAFGSTGSTFSSGTTGAFGSKPVSFLGRGQLTY